MSNTEKSGTDFNDLMHEKGIEEVKHQIFKQLDKDKPAANDSPETSDENPPGPSQKGDAFPIETLLKIYMWVMPDGKVWDASKRRVLKSGAFKNMVGAKRYAQWVDHEERLTVEADEVSEIEAAAQKEGGGGIAGALNRYVYLYPTDSVWDTDTNQVVPMSGLKYAIASCFSFWVTHPYRKQINVEDLVFEPSGNITEEQINRFTGIKMQPVQNTELAMPIFDLAQHLCNYDEAAYDYLIKWMAYPLQNLGSKMASAIMMHSEVHGSGKSLFFEECWKGIYGEWGATLGQHQLESQYTDWRSSKLCAIFEEIFSRDQKYSHTGTIKHMITGKTHRIEKKFVAGWEEHNFMNAVFLSNEIMPFPLEPSDRRMLVIWPKTKLPDELNKRVMHSINNGGVEAFYHALLHIPLDGMTTHTEPPMTEAKEELIDFGRANWDIFFREWESGGLDIPYITCEAKQLFRAYDFWCAERRESRMGSNKFSNLIAKRLRRRRDVRVEGSDRKYVIFVVPQDQPRDGETQAQMLKRLLAEFKQAVEILDPANRITP